MKNQISDFFCLKRQKGLSVEPVKGILFVVLFFLSSGCSPWSLFGGGKDENILKQPTYHSASAACANVDLSGPRLTTPSFRALVTCLNDNKLIDPIERLVNKLPEEDLDPIVQELNETLFVSGDTFKKVEHSFYTLKKSGLLAKSFQDVSVMMRPDLIVSILKLMNDAYYVPAVGAQAERPDPELLKAVELLSKKLEPQMVAKVLDIALNLLGSRSYQDLRSQILASDLSEAELLNVFVGMNRFLSADHHSICDGEEIPFRHDWQEAVRSGLWFQALDEVVGTEREEIKVRVSELHQLFEILIANERNREPMLKRLSDAMRTFNRPITCAKGTQTVPNGARHILRRLVSFDTPSEASQYIATSGKLELVSLRPLCDLPAGVSQHYSSLSELSQMGGMSAMHRLARAMAQETQWKGCWGTQDPTGQTYQPLMSLLVNSMADDKGGGMSSLLPALNHLSKMDVLPEILLLLTVPSYEDTQEIRSFLSYLVERQPDLGGRTIIDVFSNSAARAKVPHLVQFALAFSDFLQEVDPQSDRDQLSETIQGFRKAFYVNDVHPFVEMAQSAMSRASDRTRLFEVVFGLSHDDDFRGTVTTLGKMAQNGELIMVFESFLKFTHAIARQSPLEIRETEIPPFIANRGVDLARADLVRALLPAATEREEACGRLSLDFDLSRPEQVGFRQQFDTFLTCINRADLKWSIDQLLTEKTSNGRSYYDHLLDIAKGLVEEQPDRPGQSLSSEEVGFLMARWLEKVKSGELFDVFSAVPFLTLREQGNPSISDNLVTFLGAAYAQSRYRLRDLGDFGARLLKDDRFPELLAELKTAVETEVKDDTDFSIPAPLGESQVEQETRLKKRRSAGPKFPEDADIRAFVSQWECQDLVGLSASEIDAYLDARVLELKEEAFFDETTWQLKSNENSVTGKSGLRSWDFAEFVDVFDPIANAMTDPRRQHPNRSFIESQSHFFKRFSGQPVDGVVSSPEKLLDWLHVRSQDYQLIPYYYPGERKPRARLVNTLDRLELVLWNTDVDFLPFDLPYYGNKNLGLLYLDVVAQAWGEVAPRNRPAELKNRTDLLTLPEAIDDITNRKDPTENLYRLTDLIGLPPIPSCVPKVNYKTQMDPPSDLVDPPFWWHLMLGIKKTLPSMYGEARFHNIQNRLFNTYFVTNVLKENVLHLVPKEKRTGAYEAYKDSDTPYISKKRPHLTMTEGMSVLRTLFYEVSQSTPDRYRNAWSGDDNNLSNILRSIRMGSFRQMGRKIQNYASDDSRLKDLIRAMIAITQSKEGVRLTESLMRAGSDSHELFYQAIQEIFDFIDESERNGEPERIAILQDLGLYGLGTVNQIFPGEKPESAAFHDLVSSRFVEILDQNGAFLSKHPRILRKTLRAAKTSKQVRSIYTSLLDGKVSPERIRWVLEDAVSFENRGVSLMSSLFTTARRLYEEDTSRAAFEMLWDQIADLEHHPGFPLDEVEKASEEMLDFFAHLNLPQEASERQASIGASNKIRLYLAHILENRDAEELLALCEKNPEAAQGLIRSLGRAVEAGPRSDLAKFLKMVRKSLSAPQH